MFKKVLIASMIAASFGAAPVIASAQQRAIVITQAPPAPREEHFQVRRGYEWAPGHWVWRNGEHRWVEGRYIRERRGMHWVADRWVERNGRWELVAGHWERGNRNAMGNRGMNDRDRDGVPNRYDRDRDNDGVPNRLDSNPNNPRRN
jgi:hypothetical protein